MAFCLFCTQGYMSTKEFKEECTAGKWLPILVMRVGDNAEPIMPMFDSAEIAAKFVKRNLPKGWVCGTVNLRLKDAHWMDNRGWKAIKYDYPKLLKDVVKFDVEIIEFEPEHKLVIKV